MRKILIATHGHLANGIKSSLEVLCGVQRHVTYMNAYVDDFDLDAAIQQFFNEVCEDDQVVIFTDIMGGSVNQKLLPYRTQSDVFLIAGFNLAIVVDLVIGQERLTADLVEQKVNESRNQLVFMNEVELESREKEESFFE